MGVEEASNREPVRQQAGPDAGVSTAFEGACSPAQSPDRRAEVVIPTRNRPARLRRCLERIRAEGPLGARIPILVCDSSTGTEREATAEAAAAFGARYAHHDRRGAAAARNECARLARSEVLVSVDDDVYVLPGALTMLLAAWDDTLGPAAVAGSVRFGPSHWSEPGAMRLVGYGRALREGEAPDYVISSFFCYARAVALRWPWNEGLLSSEDLFMGFVWRHQGVTMRFAPQAQALHDDNLNSYGPEHYRYHVYVNLADALFGRRSLIRALCYEVLGLPLALKDAGPRRIGLCVRAWVNGHRDLLRDAPRLRSTWFARAMGAVPHTRRMQAGG